MGKKYRKSKSFYDYEFGVCQTCHQFLTDCICEELAAVNNGFEKYESSMCEECLQPLNDCICGFYNCNDDITYITPEREAHHPITERYYQKSHDFASNYGVYVPPTNPFEFESFEDLKKKVPANNYIIEHTHRGSSVSIIAPHGGSIEQGTTELAKMMAASKYNYYSFIGIDRPETDLHITSHKFNEPTCIELLKKSNVVVAIHGCPGDDEKVLIGGKDLKLKKKALKKFSKNGFKTAIRGHIYPGIHPDNVCNLGKKGLQLEFTLGLRKNLEVFGVVSKIVQEILGSM